MDFKAVNGNHIIFSINYVTHPIAARTTFVKVGKDVHYR